MMIGDSCSYSVCVTTYESIDHYNIQQLFIIQCIYNIGIYRKYICIGYFA